MGLTLRVNPQINENGTVKMTIFQETSTVQAGTENAANGPTTNKRSIESSVLVDDGGLVVLGGLLQDTTASNHGRIPLAGDIPVLGNLFKSRNRNAREDQPDGVPAACGDARRGRDRRVSTTATTLMRSRSRRRNQRTTPC